MELDKALEFAVILGWDDLKKVSDPCSARVEYRSVAGTAVDYLSIWSVDAEGHQAMVCNYWTKTSPGHTSGIGFKNKFQSPPLGLALGLHPDEPGSVHAPSRCLPGGSGSGLPAHRRGSYRSHHLDGRYAWRRDQRQPR